MAVLLGQTLSSMDQLVPNRDGILSSFQHTGLITYPKRTTRSSRTICFVSGTSHLRSNEACGLVYIKVAEDTPSVNLHAKQPMYPGWDYLNAMSLAPSVLIMHSTALLTLMRLSDILRFLCWYGRGFLCGFLHSPSFCSVRFGRAQLAWWSCHVVEAW